MKELNKFDCFIIGMIVGVFLSVIMLIIFGN